MDKSAATAATEAEQTPDKAVQLPAGGARRDTPAPVKQAEANSSASAAAAAQPEEPIGTDEPEDF